MHFALFLELHAEAILWFLIAGRELAKNLANRAESILSWQNERYGYKDLKNNRIQSGRPLLGTCMHKLKMAASPTLVLSYIMNYKG